MPTKLTPELIQQFRIAWKKLPPEVRDKLEPQVLAAHNHLKEIKQGTLQIAQTKPTFPRELLLVHSLLNNDPVGLLSTATVPALATLAQPAAGAGIFPHIDSDGGIYFGGLDYDNTDLGWVNCIIAWEQTQNMTPPFNTSPAIIEIPDACTLAIIGDWGGNNAPAQKVAAAANNLKSKPDYFIHIGDVYYVGTDGSPNGSTPKNQQNNLLSTWPGVAGRSFNLNSNHDMYAHGTGYFKTALASPTFSAQKNCSYFVLFNSLFRLIGLDTAYYATDPGPTGYMDGCLGLTGSPQTQFLLQQAAAAAANKQQLIILSHHNGLSLDGSSLASSATPNLWQQVMGIISPQLPSGSEVIWYWGHQHAAAVYKPQTNFGLTILPRCCGHGCIPWGTPSALNSPNVVWCENEILGPGANYVVTNGFATIQLNGPSLGETFYDQNGSMRWSNLV